MERLTTVIESPKGRGVYYAKGLYAPTTIFADMQVSGIRECMHRLAAYEDTGLTPEEILDGKMLTGWIPVEEKLPGYDGLYLVCLDDGYISSAEYMTGRNRKRDWDLWPDNGEVIAWMPLPEPYRAETRQTEKEECSDEN